MNSQEKAREAIEDGGAGRQLKPKPNEKGGVPWVGSVDGWWETPDQRFLYKPNLLPVKP